eukprot:8452053-Heterocapsa_arctica.AAC.1
MEFLPSGQNHRVASFSTNQITDRLSPFLPGPQIVHYLMKPHAESESVLSGFVPLLGLFRSWACAAPRPVPLLGMFRS